MATEAADTTTGSSGTVGGSSDCGVTVTTDDPRLFSETAVIFTVPAETALKPPVELTVAMDEFCELQVRLRFVSTVPDASATLAVSCVSSAMPRLSADGVMVTEATDWGF